jgi:thiopurine S-methyltransferase
MLHLAYLHTYVHVMYHRRQESSDILARWSQRWTDNKLGWHKTEPHQFLIKYGSELVPQFLGTDEGVTCLADEKDPKEKVRIFVPLCGKTMDMAFLAHHTSVDEVVGCDGIRKALTDFSEEHDDLGIEEVSSVGAFDSFKGKGITLLKGNHFELDDEVTGGKFDGILDRASIVAINPDLREKYVDIMGQLIKPGGSILLVTVDRREGTQEGMGAGPPFSVDDKEIQRLYANLDWVDSVTKLEECDEFQDEESKSRYTMQGVDSLFELVYVIKAKPAQEK